MTARIFLPLTRVGYNTPVNQPDPIRIPRSDLRRLLDESAAIKADMTRLLAELEHAATPDAPKQPGTWRHHPHRWPRTDR
jgi:hypothetical protein